MIQIISSLIIIASSLTQHPTTKGLYVDHFAHPNYPIILGNSGLQDQLLRWCQTYSIDFIALYDLDLGYNTWGDNLRSFVAKSRIYGITAVGAALPTTPKLVTQLINYNKNCINNQQRIDRYVIQQQWWNGQITYSEFLSNLVSMNKLLHSLSKPILIDLYIGWPKQTEMKSITPLIDRLLIHDYVIGPPNYAYTRGRLLEISSYCAQQKRILDIMCIASAEASFSGSYFRSNSISSFYEGYTIKSNINPYFNNETNINITTYINPVGVMAASPPL